ncbi:hypothetical protein [Brucella grignonensis]|uniref:hypothetical protein n=1 Tax=Brucella grignonensis TaxID=94627 RepID=UPI000B997E12|nr:hypothetical protein [Brucella grignonensis]NKB84086.1 hypothetical protein [Brucella grignonensis]
MADDFIPNDPTSGSPTDGRLDNLEARLAFIEADRAAKALSAEDEYNNLLKHEVLQRILMRYAVMLIAVIVIAIMVTFATYVLCHYVFFPIVYVAPTVTIALYVAPVVSISTVTIMLLIGAFRRFKDDDIEQVNSQAVIESAKAIAGS